MSVTRVAIHADDPRARVEIVAGTIVPRLIDRGPRSAHIALVAGGALLLGGDRIDIAITVGEGCTLDLEDIGGTVAYGADGVASFWNVDAVLEPDACLRWAGLPLVVADGADVHRHTRIRLGARAVALIRESVVLGRTGERGGRARIRTSITDAGGPVLEESVDAVGDNPVPGVLGRHRFLDSVVLAGCHGEHPTSPKITYMPLSEPGAIARYLGDTAHASPLTSVWTQWSDLTAAAQSSSLSRLPAAHIEGK